VVVVVLVDKLEHRTHSKVELPVLVELRLEQQTELRVMLLPILALVQVVLDWELQLETAATAALD
jgi:hypothetical protein